MNMAQNKNSYIFFAVAFLAVLFLSVKTINAGTLSCALRTGSCNGGEVEIFEMQKTSNSHAGTPLAGYNNLVCCGGVAGLGNSCSGTFATVLKLSGISNAHVRQGTGSDYPSSTNACISVPGGGNVVVGYQPTDCAGYDTILGSMSNTTNSHVGDSAWTNGVTKICATAAATGAFQATGFLISSTFDTGETQGVAYNSIMWKGALNGGKVKMQIATSSASTGSWNFLGPDCSSSTYYESAADSPAEILCASDAYHNNKQFFRYKITICSNSDCSARGSASPEVTGVIVNWSP